MPSSPPLLPLVPVLQSDDSMLTRRFGREVINYYAGSHLNRYSFLRSDAGFLSKAIAHPTSQFIALRDLCPLVSSKTRLSIFNYDDVKAFLGGDPFSKSEDEFINAYDSTIVSPLVVFLGTLDGLGSAQLETTNHGPITGSPFFAVDVTPRGSYAEAAETFLKKAEEHGATLQKDPRSMTLHSEAASMFAQARSMIDWNTRNKFCAGCGNPNLSVHAGYKRVCPPTDRRGGSQAVALEDCPTRHGVSNICFPRADPTMIAAVVSADGQRVLLGRQSRWPPNWYSTLAGFIEPGESIEEAVRREVWEESGVKVGRVVVHSSQPWPYPASLMIGSIAQALPGEGEIITLNDKELESAKWFPIEEVRDALNNGTSGLGDPAPEGYKEGGLRVPPGQAIANRLMTAVVEGFLSGTPKI